jgi:Flp pilus assembly protein TadG
MKLLSPCLKRMFTSRKGNVSIIFALASPLVIGSAALGVETSYWYYQHHQLQAAADNAAMAAGFELKNGSSLDVVKAAALNAAVQNGYDGVLPIGFQTPPTSGPGAGMNTAVMVTLTENQKRFFTQLFSNKPVVAEANATANWKTTANACILALDPTAPQAAYFSGSANLTLTGCVVMSDSAAKSGVDVWGAGSLTASCVVSAGGVQQKSGGINDTGCVKAQTNAQPAPDPYQSLAWPALASTPCTAAPNPLPNPIPSGSHYCSLDIGPHNITLQAGGQFVFDNFYGSSNGSLTGDGVTIFTNHVQIDGDPTFNLSAPTSGPYTGILFFGNRAPAYVGSTDKFNGNASSLMTGALYFPTQTVSYLGDFSGVNGCTQIVADMVSFSGNTNFSANCSNLPPPIAATASVTLVE